MGRDDAARLRDGSRRPEHGVVTLLRVLPLRAALAVSGPPAADVAGGAARTADGEPRGAVGMALRGLGRMGSGGGGGDRALDGVARAGARRRDTCRRQAARAALRVLVARAAGDHAAESGAPRYTPRGAHAGPRRRSTRRRGCGALQATLGVRRGPHRRGGGARRLLECRAASAATDVVVGAHTCRPADGTPDRTRAHQGDSPQLEVQAAATAACGRTRRRAQAQLPRAARRDGVAHQL